MNSASHDFLNKVASQSHRTVLADPPWQFQNKTGKVAPEHKRRNRYGDAAERHLRTASCQRLS